MASVQPISDAIIVGDTGSTDDTITIARSFGADVFDVDWRDDFAYMRNRVFAGAAAIRALVDADGHGAQGIWTCLANYCDTPSSWRWMPAPPNDPFARGYADYMRAPLLRLFKNGLGIEYHEAEYEDLGASLQEVGATLRSSSIMIHHYGFYPNVERNKEKALYYLELARDKMKKYPD